MSEFTFSDPEKEEVVLLVKDTGLEIKNFTEYSFNSNFLAPTDGWSFSIGAEKLSDEQRNQLVPGTSVQLKINGSVQSTGFIDSIEIHASRGSGTVYRIEGRDRLGQVVDACADPTVSLKEGQTLEEALLTVFKPFGWSTPDQILDENTAARNVKVGSAFNRGGKTRKSEAKGFGKRAIKAYKTHLLRPYAREGVFEFANRLAQRFGLWIWLTPSGDNLVVSKPDFETDPFYKLIRKNDGTTNVLDGSVKFDVTDQPTHIIADSYSQGGEFGHGRLKAIYINKAVSFGDLPVPEALDKYKKAGAVVVESPTFPFSSLMKVPRTRVLFLHDDESKTQEQLNNYVKREMALLQRKSLTVSYTVEGHGQNTPDGFAIWTVDTTVDVEDEVAGLNERLYVLGRTFNKSRSGGTTTHLELIRLDTLVF